MGTVANCSRCNAIFMKGTAKVCPNCRKIEEDQFHTVYTFMRKKQNRTATVTEIVEKTGVPEKQIRGFVKQKRLHPAQFPNLSYSCEKCGTEIRDGRICESCRKELEAGLEKHKRNEEMSEKIKETQIQESKTYYSVKNDR
ncbi:TIGR03826 family flagellar region protein [Halobacillus sp. BBL2006]|uniref:TIGR03826 family flagellar region protein n=1 Tax=Halobacillus sp. BBL2006 TaxID=1543706 RepID=UPI000543DC61|nr:TIGR03826 family flagellar region protein [Halobacillus sp. BBL2006]KHE68131.1 flagellar protein YvyF [Halobacillus sp. BBL2006]